jgi:SNF2 family DNA or RNA helicase
MVSFIRPGILGPSEKKFKRDFSDPIQAGMAKDAAWSIRSVADELLRELTKKMGPFIHRRNESVLLNDLASLQQVVLHVRPTKQQRALYALYRKHQRTTSINNFLHQFTSLRPIHNHPATVLFKTNTDMDSKPSSLQASSARRNSVSSVSPKNLAKKKEPVSVKEERASNQGKGKSNGSDSQQNSKSSGRESPELIDLLSDSETEDVEEIGEISMDGNWWSPFVSQLGNDRVKDVQNGNKCLILLHILAKATACKEQTGTFHSPLKSTVCYLLSLPLTESANSLYFSSQLSFLSV